MHITKVAIENIRSIRSLTWSVSESRAVGWHVIIGENGSGKSSFLQAIALALVGKENIVRLGRPESEWIRCGSQLGKVALHLNPDKEYDSYLTVEAGPSDCLAFLELARRETGTRRTASIVANSKGFDAGRCLWGRPHYDGWFSASYGPFRRFRGGDWDQESKLASFPALARHLSLFEEGIALSEAIEWLKELQFKALEEREANGKTYRQCFLEKLKRFINESGLLPHRTRLESISSDEVMFLDGNGASIRLQDLSDGYRSALSVTLDIVRQLRIAFGPEPDLFAPDNEGKTIQCPGVVLIDEIDAHLHPTWQRRIGLWFRRFFPNMQFIVTSHSPLVCQASDQGTVFWLPAPGSKARPHMIKGAELDRLVYGNVLDAYGTGVFGEGVARSEKSKQRLERLAHLNTKEIETGLTPEEASEQQRLRRIFPTDAHVLPAPQ